MAELLLEEYVIGLPNGRGNGEFYSTLFSSFSLSDTPILSYPFVKIIFSRQSKFLNLIEDFLLRCLFS